VGRNGSGKSNLFDAVQFVLLTPRFATLRSVRCVTYDLYQSLRSEITFPTGTRMHSILLGDMTIDSLVMYWHWL
jgi:recombinational DNA repair ATPase RecF